MKATTFDPTGTAAVALLAPDAVVLTVGALINKILDSLDDPVVLVLDQVEGKISVFSSDNGDITAAVASNSGTRVMLFEPGAINPVPFEGA